MRIRNSRKGLGYPGQEDYGVYGFMSESNSLPEDYRSGGINMDRFMEFCQERDLEMERNPTEVRSDGRK